MRRLAPIAAMAIISLFVVNTVDAAATSQVARLGTTNGAARLTAGGPNKIYVNAKRLARGTWTETLYKGTCAKLSTRIVTLPPLTVGATGAIARTNTITASQARLAKAGVVRLVRGRTVVCGSFATAVATPIASPSPGSSTGASPGASATPRPSGSPGASASPSPSQSTGTSGLPLEQSGTGNASTATFQAPTDWGIAYTFDCSVLGAAAGRFRVQVVTNGQATLTPVDVTATDGGDVVNITNRAGQTHLEVITDCDWGVFVSAAG